MAVDAIANQNRGFSNEQASFAPRIGSVLAAFVAMLAVYFFRSDHSSSALKLVLETVLFAITPLIAFIVIRRRLPQERLFPMPKTVRGRFQMSAILVAVLVLTWHSICRHFGFGCAYEIITLLTIQNVGWYLAIFSKVPGFEKASFILCGFSAFFVCCVTDKTQVLVMTVVYAFASLWWLLGQYWNQLDTKAIDGKTRSLPLHGAAISVTTLAMGAAICLAAVIPFSQSQISLRGFMPFSGGKDGYADPFAISGIGDGNMLAAGENATTTGAVESDQIIEGHETSLYDAVSEQYNGPITKRRRGKSATLNALAKHLDNAKQSEQSGKTFRTMRNTDKTTKRKFEDRISEALFFVEGPAPARFVVNTFDHFDGWDWSQTPEALASHQPPNFRIDHRSGPDVFLNDRPPAAYLTDQRWHCIKIMRLKSNVIPAPAFLKRWRIPQVNRPDMFRWNEAGLLRMDSESIPSQTMIHLQGLVANYHHLRDASNHQSSASNQINSEMDSPFLQTPATTSQLITSAMTRNETAKVTSRWEQVEAIVSHVRHDFELNPTWKTNDEAENSVAEFLKQGGGPAYMFATTCAMALRSAGFETRLANGFLVRQSDYDSYSRQSIVTSENLHIWPEVSLDGKFWIPVEPTPGYPTPHNTQSLWQWLTTQANVLVGWLISHPISTLFALTATCWCVVCRARVVTSLMFLWWSLVRLFWPQGLLKTTCQLIDLRFWFAGDRRPKSATVPAWYARVEPHLAGRFFELWNAKNYSDRPRNVSKSDLVHSCRNSVNSLTLQRIRDFANLTKKDDTP